MVSNIETMLKIAIILSIVYIEMLFFNFYIQEIYRILADSQISAQADQSFFCLVDKAQQTPSPFTASIKIAADSRQPWLRHIKMPVFMGVF